jgi:hypothetical protein
MVLFATFVAIIFGVVGREKSSERLTYGAKIFAEFVGIGLLLAWVLYWLPL